jgi:hypothetical protein
MLTIEKKQENKFQSTRSFFVLHSEMSHMIDSNQEVEFLF